MEVAALVLAAAVFLNGLLRVPAAAPLYYWAFVALPLTGWSAPLFADVSRSILARLVFALAVCFVLARRHGGRRRDAGRVRFFLFVGVVVVLVRGSIPANELAGILTLFVPFTLALAVSPAFDARRRLKWRWQWLALTVVFGTALASTGSRGGIFATVFASAAVLVAAEKRGRRLLIAGAMGGLVAAVAAGWERLLDVLVYSGAARGLSWDVVLSGRPAIWRRALHALADAPATGLGPGTFGAGVDTLYPGLGSPIEDAHNFYLEIALGLGLPGLVAFLAFVGVLVRRLAAAWPGASALRRSQLLGLGGGLAAHLAYGLTDSVSPGSMGNLAWWCLCGLVLAFTRPDKAEDSRPWRTFALLFAIFLALVLWPGMAARHRATVVAAQALLTDRGLDRAASYLADIPSCRARWLEGLVAQKRGRPEEAARAWTKLVECPLGGIQGGKRQRTPAFLELLPHVSGPDAERRLAERAAAVWDGEAEAHFWLARVLVRSGGPAERERAVALYRRGLALVPSAPAWLELGDLLATSEPRSALAAYAEACHRGDPGANACARAGAVAEGLGDIDAAVGFYRSSRWQKARDRARELEPEAGRPGADHRFFCSSRARFVVSTNKRTS